MQAKVGRIAVYVFAIFTTPSLQSKTELIHRYSYKESLTFLYSVPIYTVRQPIRILVVDRSKFFVSLRHIQNLSISKHFYQFPQEGHPQLGPFSMTGWRRVCDTLASMPDIHYLCITITQVHFNFEYRPPEESVRLVTELLEPLKAVKVVGGGQFDVVTKGWRMPCDIIDVPFQVLEEREPIDPLSQHRLKVLGGFLEPSPPRQPVSIPRPRH